MLLLLAPAAAAPGDLDPSFGTEGIVLTPIGSYGSAAAAVLLQPDGRIVLGGSSDSLATLARYLPNGSLDPSYGSGGIVRGPWESVSGGALQADGKVLLAGYAQFGGGGDFRFSVVRFDPDGSLDTTFGTSGRASGPRGFATGIAVQPDGRIVLVGWDNAGGFILTRLSSDGTFDSTFGTNGVVRTRIGDSAEAGAVAVQGDGKLVAAGTSRPTDQSSLRVLALARYLPDGTLDPSFGSNGTSTAAVVTGAVSVSSMVLQPDGRIVVGGRLDDQIGVARFLPDGRLDTSFAADGVVTTPVGSSASGNGVALQADGRIVVAGTGREGFVLVRYERDGRLDAGFGDGGVVTSQVGRLSAANSVVIQPDGRILAAGTAVGSSRPTFALARYLVTTPSTISAHSSVVDYGRSIRLSGTLTTGQPGQVTVLEQGCLARSRSTATDTSAGTDGVWSASVQPRTRTVYWAGVGAERSPAVTVRVRPRLTLKRVGKHTVRARALFGLSLAGESVVLQRHSGAKGWLDLRDRTLGITTRGSTVVSGTTFRVTRHPGRRLRLVLIQDGLFDCFARAASKPIRD